MQDAVVFAPSAFTIIPQLPAGVADELVERSLLHGEHLQERALVYISLELIWSCSDFITWVQKDGNREVSDISLLLLFAVNLTKCLEPSLASVLLEYMNIQVMMVHMSLM